MWQAIKSLIPGQSQPFDNYTTPSSDELAAERERTQFTPDIAKLEQYEWQLIFVTDELKKQHLKNSLLGSEQRYKFPAFTQKNFHYWQHEAPFNPPVPFRVADDVITNPLPFYPPIGKIKGQVFIIRPQAFLDLDNYKQNTVEFQRHRVRLVVPYRKLVWLKDHNLDPAFGVQEAFCRSEYNGKSVTHSKEIVCIIRAWMYIGIPSFWDPLITAYDWGSAEHYHSNTRRWCETFYSIRRPPHAGNTG